MPGTILFIRHIAIEGPGSMQGFFEHTAWRLSTVKLDAGEDLPRTLDEIEALIVLGGPMNVYEEGAHPFLKDEDRLLKEALERDIPVMGICLGAQLLAKASNAAVTRAPVREIGWHEVELTANARSDPLFYGLPQVLNVFQWHEDTFAIPEKGVHLAASSGCPNQAFRARRHAYGLQFHVEVTPPMIESWIGAYGAQGNEKMLLQAYKNQEPYLRQASQLYLNFARIIVASRKEVRV